MGLQDEGIHVVCQAKCSFTLCTNEIALLCKRNINTLK